MPPHIQCKDLFLSLSPTLTLRIAECRNGDCLSTCTRNLVLMLLEQVGTKTVVVLNFLK